MRAEVSSFWSQCCDQAHLESADSFLTGELSGSCSNWDSLEPTSVAEASEFFRFPAVKQQPLDRPVVLNCRGVISRGQPVGFLLLSQ